jgi:hypothetical protein
MLEELLDEAAYKHLPVSSQEDLIAAHCSHVEQRILSAPTAVEAKAISDDACRLFREECASELIRRELTDHVMGLYKKHWENES